MTASSYEIITAYRSLLRTSLHAVQYATPGKYQVRDILRDSFRNSPATAFIPRRIANTLRFLGRARDYQGLENKILKNITRIRWERSYGYDSGKLTGAIKENTDVGRDLRVNVPGQFDATLAMLNESEGLCLRV